MQTETINIDIDAPDGSEFASASVMFTLSGADADSTTGETVPAHGVSATLDASGEGSITLWPVDRGYQGRHYVVTLYARDVAGNAVREYALGTIQPTDGDGPFDLGDLLGIGSGAVTPGVYRLITPAEYAEIALLNTGVEFSSVTLTDATDTPKQRTRITAGGETVQEVDVAGSWVEVSRVNVTSGGALAGRLRFYEPPVVGTSVSTAGEVFHPRNLQPQIPEGVNYASLGLQQSRTMAPTKPVDVAPVTLSSATPYLYSAGDLGRVVYADHASTVLDVQKMAIGQSAEVWTNTGATCAIYAGEGNSYVGGSDTTKTLPAASFARVVRLSATLVAIQTDATLTGSSAAPAARARTIATVGQSLSVQLFDESGLRGLQDGGQTDIWPITAGTGSTSLLDDWWDVDTSSPLTAATDAIAAIAARPAGQPAPAMLIWDQGEGDAGATEGSPPTFRFKDTGDYTPARYKTALEELFAWFRSQLSDATLPIMIVPLGSADNNLNPQGYWAIRRIQGEVATADANVHIGPEKYDLPRDMYDVHLTYAGNIILGQRVAANVGNILDAETNDTGPRIVAFTALTSTTFAVDIDFDGIPLRPGATSGFSSDPVGFALLSGTTIADTPYTIVDYAWSTNGSYARLTLTTSADATGCVLAYPYGPFPDVRTGNYVRNLGGDSLPLRVYGA